MTQLLATFYIIKFRVYVYMSIDYPSIGNLELIQNCIINIELY